MNLITHTQIPRIFLALILGSLVTACASRAHPTSPPPEVACVAAWDTTRANAYSEACGIDAEERARRRAEMAKFRADLREARKTLGFWSALYRPLAPCATCY